MRDRAWPPLRTSHPPPCFAFNDFPFTVAVTVMIRPADDENTMFRHGRPFAYRLPKQGCHTRRKWTGFVLRSMRGLELAVAAPARPSGSDGRDGLTTTAAAAVAAGTRGAGAACFLLSRFNTC